MDYSIELLKSYMDEPDRKTTLCTEDGKYLPKWYVVASLMIYEPIDHYHVHKALNHFYQKIESGEIWFLDEYEREHRPIKDLQFDYDDNKIDLLDLSKTTDNYDNIKEYAVMIKEFCTQHKSNEKDCPFYRGEKYIDDNTSIIQCELNKGNCSPCNWKI